MHREDLLFPSIKIPRENKTSTLHPDFFRNLKRFYAKNRRRLPICLFRLKLFEFRCQQVMQGEGNNVGQRTNGEKNGVSCRNVSAGSEAIQ